MRGRFAHPELIDILTDTRFIEFEREIAKLESDYNPSTGFIKSSSNTTEETVDTGGLVETVYGTSFYRIEMLALFNDMIIVDRYLWE